MRLYLVQHGEAVSKDVDPRRPLTDEGRSEIERLASFLGRSGVRVERVVHSGKHRAEQTAKLLANQLAPAVNIQAMQNLSPNDPIDPLHEELQNWATDTVVVGHLPYMGKLVANLVAGDEQSNLVEFQPGSIVCLEKKHGQDWMIVWMIPPQLISGA